MTLTTGTRLGPPYGFAEARVSWAADNRHVVLTGSVTRAGPFGQHLYLADTATGSVQLITSGVLNEVSPSVSPEGSRVAFASGSEDADLIRIAIDGFRGASAAGQRAGRTGPELDTRGQPGGVRDQCPWFARDLAADDR